MTQLNSEQIQLLKDELTVELTEWLMEKFGYSSTEAIDVLYTSETFDRLPNTSTGFYYQSVGYIASFLENEITRAVFC